MVASCRTWLPNTAWARLWSAAATLRHKLTLSFSLLRAAGGRWASRDEPVSWTRPRFLHISFF